VSEEKPTQKQPFSPKSPESTGKTAPVRDDSAPGSRRPNGTGIKFNNGKEPRYEVTPVFWENLIDALPPWFDEISAIVLLVFGVISLMAVLNVSSDATLAIAWSNALTQLFGDGGILVSIGIFALGVIILLPKAGIVVHFSVRRVLALEIAFLTTLAILHLAANDPAPRALARAGEGGGYIGWGISWPMSWLFGTSVALALCFGMLVFSIGLAIGIHRSQVSEWLEQASDKLEELGNTLLGRPNGDKETPVEQNNGLTPVDRVPPLALDAALGKRFSVMRIRPDLENLPPSQRPEVAPASPPNIVERGLNAPIPDEVSERLGKALFRASEDMPPEKLRRRHIERAIGTVLPPAKKKGAPRLVERPDGRIKRYFTVEGMQENKKVGRRSKVLPPLDLLADIPLKTPDEHEINHNALLIENTLLEFDIHIDVVDVKVGPTVTQYAIQPFREVRRSNGEIVRERTRLSRIAALRNDLSLTLAAKRLRLETPVPGQSYMGVEVPNKNPSVVTLRSVYESEAYYQAARKNKSPLLVPLGRDVAGVPLAVDLGMMPHLLIAGTTGSGKSVCIAAIATALVLNNTPDQVKMVMLDPKMVELSRFNGLPHLLGPVETDMERIIGVLRWCTREMDRRYRLLEENSARNIEIYNSRLGQRKKSEHLPYMVIMVDEIGDLMLTKPEETEKALTRIAQMARAVGMHLVVATQRPSVDVITGLIKANFPSRISFAVAAGVDSRVILDSVGAETLMGKGDMLYLASDAAGPRRLQGCYVSDDEVHAIVAHWRAWQENKKTTERSMPPWELGLTRREFLSGTDPMLEDAIALVINEQEASASQIQRKLGLGYPRAARIIDLLEELGVIGEQVAGGRSRVVLIKKGQDPYKFMWENHKHDR
jgi:hypothetical protein